MTDAISTSRLKIKTGVAVKVQVELSRYLQECRSERVDPPMNSTVLTIQETHL